MIPISIGTMRERGAMTIAPRFLFMGVWTCDAAPGVLGDIKCVRDVESSPRVLQSGADIRRWKPKGILRR